jgi:hypothetical protein
MAGIEAFRPIVVARAGGACEYCRLRQDARGVTFHVEHVRPRSLDGRTELSNLALSCPGCNLAKSSRLTGADRAGREQPIYNPREYDPSLLGWYLHFLLERETGLVVPRTPVGEATLELLRMNEAQRLFARKLQIAAGLIS